MTTSPEQGNKLSNLRSQSLKPLLLNDVEIQSREDGYINATQMCKAGGKKFAKWYENNSTKELIKELESEIRIRTSQLIDVKKGNSSKFSQGSWIHPDLAVHLAQWISPRFAIQVSRWIDELKHENFTLQKQLQQVQKYRSQTLNLDGLVIESRQDDGYINATQLCKAGKKRFAKWYENDSTKELIKELIKELEIKYPNSDIKTIDSKKGRYGGSWVHPDLAVHLAQWISPRFAIQVSRWVRELLLFGKVELGDEKSTQELEEKYQEKVDKLQLTLTWTERKLQASSQEMKDKTLEFRRMRKNHNNLLRKRTYYKFKKGPSFYVWYDPNGIITKFKVGYSENINQRLAQERTSVPELKLVYLVYSPSAKLLEDMILHKFRERRVPLNHELIKIKSETIIKSCHSLLKYFKSNYTEENELYKYNEIELEMYDDSKDVNIIFLEDDEYTRKCSKCQKILPLDKFNKGCVLRGGLDNNCKECCNKKYQQMKKTKKTAIDMKKCPTCNVVKNIVDYYNRDGSSNGKSSQCKKCIINQYKNRVTNRDHKHVESKMCIGCDKTKTIVCFGKKKDSIDGYMPRCKKCWNIFCHKNASTIQPKNFKVCTTCKIKRPISNFWNKKQNTDGKDNKCKLCWKKRG